LQLHIFELGGDIPLCTWSKTVAEIKIGEIITGESSRKEGVRG
jgi:4-diphosphocytidyl-2C-methyl-D-erythritol kinase